MTKASWIAQLVIHARDCTGLRRGLTIVFMRPLWGAPLGNGLIFGVHRGGCKVARWRREKLNTPRVNVPDGDGRAPAGNLL